MERKNVLHIDVLDVESLHVEDIDMEDILPLHLFHLLEMRLILGLCQFTSRPQLSPLHQRLCKLLKNIGKNIGCHKGGSQPIRSG